MFERAGIKREPGKIAYAPDVETAISMAIVHARASCRRRSSASRVEPDPDDGGRGEQQRDHDHHDRKLLRRWRAEWMLEVLGRGTYVRARRVPTITAMSPTGGSEIRSSAASAYAADGMRSPGALISSFAIKPSSSPVTCGAQFDNARRRLVDVHRHDLDAGLGEERRAPGEQLEQDAADRVEVGARVDLARAPGTAPAPCTPACRGSCRPWSPSSRRTDRMPSFAIPKSRIFTRTAPGALGSRTITMLSGLRSRWIDAARRAPRRAPEQLCTR